MKSLTLQRLILDTLAEQDLSYRAAAERSRGMVTHTTLNTLANGRRDPKTLTDQSIAGIALALGVSEREVRKAIGLSRTEPPTVFKLPAKANRLTPKQRKVILATIDAFLSESDERTGTEK